MKTSTFIDLIKYHYEGDRAKFNSTLKLISDEFSNEGNELVSKKIRNVLNQNIEISKSTSGTNNERLIVSELILPNEILVEKEIIINRIKNSKNLSHKLLFFGPPGTGKTELAKMLALNLKKKITVMNFNEIISSFLGETSKNIQKFFAEFDFANNILFLDEVDGLVSNRDSIKSEEMYRATIEFMKSLDKLKNKEIVIAATNIISSIDDALKRRFDSVVDFDVYSMSDLINIFNHYFTKYKIKIKRDALKNFMISRDLFRSPDSIRNFLEKIHLSQNGGFEGKVILTYKKNSSNSDYINELSELGFSNKFIGKVMEKSERTIIRLKKDNRNEKK